MFKLFVFEESFGNECGTYEAFILAENTEQAIKILGEEYEVEYNFKPNLENVLPKKIVDSPTGFIRFFDN